jgi:hypothetical protein
VSSTTTRTTMAMTAMATSAPIKIFAVFDIFLDFSVTYL